MLQVLAFDAFCQAINRDMKTVLGMMDATAGGVLGQPALSRDSRTPQAPVIAGLNAPLDEVREASPAKAPFGRTSSPETHLNPFWGLAKSSAYAGAQMSSAAGAAAAPAAPLAAVLPFPVALPASDTHQRGQQLQAGRATPGDSPTETAAEATASPSWGFQQRTARAVELRRSFDVGAAGRQQRRPIHAVNSRTSLLSMSSMSSAAPTTS